MQTDLNGDDKMIGKKDVLHNSQNIYYRSTVGAAEAGSSVRLGITIKTDAVIKQVDRKSTRLNSSHD